MRMTLSLALACLAAAIGLQRIVVSGHPTLLSDSALAEIHGRVIFRNAIPIEVACAQVTPQLRNIAIDCTVPANNGLPCGFCNMQIPQALFVPMNNAPLVKLQRIMGRFQCGNLGQLAGLCNNLRCNGIPGPNNCANQLLNQSPAE